MKILSVGACCFTRTDGGSGQTERRRDRHDEANSCAIMWTRL